MKTLVTVLLLTLLTGCSDDADPVAMNILLREVLTERSDLSYNGDVCRQWRKSPRKTQRRERWLKEHCTRLP